MPLDEVDRLKKRIEQKEAALESAKKEEEDTFIKPLETQIKLLKLELEYSKGGGATLKAPDKLSQIEFLMTKKRELLRGFEKGLEDFPTNHIEYNKYSKIMDTVLAQYEYLAAKQTVIAENRALNELGRYIQIAESDGVKIVASTLEHEAQLDTFKPVKKERKKEPLFVLDFRKMALIVTVLLLFLSVYVGTVWRKTPYDRDIVINYVTARNHYIKATDGYMAGDFEKSTREYAIAAAFFNKAAKDADLAKEAKSGKMEVYFDNKKKFFQSWEQISLKMTASSAEFDSGNYDEGVNLVVESVGLSKLANSYNELAEQAWSII
jgi:hypothetical protein